MKWGCHSHCFMLFFTRIIILLIITEAFQNVCFLERRCNQLGMSMIAEGVETVEQADFLKDIDCSEMQGYYFYKPMPVHEFEKIIE